jgi:solute:Na+ symporter, SSS family
MVGGLAATLLWYMIVYSKTAPKITGINVAPPLGLLDPLFVAIPISFALVIIVSLVTKKPAEEHIARAFTGIS